MSRARDAIDTRVFDIENYINELQGPHVSGPVDRGTYLMHTAILLNVISLLEADISLRAEQQEEQEQLLTDLEETNNRLRRETEEALNAQSLAEDGRNGWQERYSNLAEEVDGYIKDANDWEQRYLAREAELADAKHDAEWWRNSSAEWSKLQKKTQAALDDALYAERTKTAAVETDITLLDSDPSTFYISNNSSGGLRTFRSLEMATVWGEVVEVYPPWLDIEPEAE